MKFIAITTGDTDGVGLEITLKALLKTKLPKDVRVLYFTSTSLQKLPRSLASLEKKLITKYKVPSVTSLAEAIGFVGKQKVLRIQSPEDPGAWVKAVTKLALTRNDIALVTGPLSKAEMKKWGHAELGHTEILKKMSGQAFLFQTYFGSKANVMLVTDHIPVSQISKTLADTAVFEEALKAAKSIHEKMGFKKPIAVLGLNPHASEEGLIGNEDLLLKETMTSTDSKLFKGPLPADSAFTKDALKSYSLFVATYHDQGLIPFKTLHGFDEGVHLTSNLSFVRTSVDHGTAKSLFGKNKANAGSMIDAIQTAIKLLNKVGKK